MSIRAIPVLLVCLVLISVVSYPVAADIQFSSFKHAKLAAVYTTSSGEKGVLTDLYVYATEGSGHVFVDTQPFTQIDMQGSARLAALVACDVLNLNPNDYDFFYVVRVNSPVVGGPSGGASMTVATIASLLNLSMRDDVVMTGMINPDGSVGPVGGIPAKLRAAASEGVKTFLIPEGQGTVYVKKMHREQRGPFVFISETTEKVNITQLGRELGVRVVEVGDIRDAVEQFTGYHIEEKTYAGGALTEQFKQTMKPLAESLLNEVNTRYARASAINDSSFSSELSAVKSLYNRAKSLYDKGDYYASTSQSFGALIKLRYVEYSMGYVNAKNANEYISQLHSEVKEEIAKSNRTIRQAASSAELINIEGLGAAESRVQEAQGLLSQATSARSAQEMLQLLAFAYERARSASWWIAIAQHGGVKGLNEDDLKSVAAGYISQAQSIATYSSTLLDESGATGLMPLVNRAMQDIDSAKAQFEVGFYAGAIYDSLQSMVRSSVAIELIGAKESELSGRLEKAEQSARNAIIRERSYGVEPILAASAYENAIAGTLGDVDKLVELGYARITARTTVSVLTDLGYTEVGVSNKTMGELIEGVSTPTPPATPSSASTPVPAKSPPMSGFAWMGSAIGIFAAAALLYAQRRK
ncbi:MAG: S16 family serine protease [Methermicoccaceae archaeon]